MNRTLEFYAGELQFCAGHFTIFSKTARERLHGHNYYLEASVAAAVDQPGITFDYRLFTDRLKALCDYLDARFLLPTESPYLTIEEEASYFHVTFDGKRMSLLAEDVLLLPLANITLEELSQWFVDQLVKEKLFIEEHQISEITIKVYNSPEHCAVAMWA